MNRARGGGLGLVVCAVFKTAGRRLWWLRWVRFPHAPASLLALAMLVALASRAQAQFPLPTPGGARSDSALAADTVKVPPFRIPPPVSPMAAMARSLVLPGWGQAALQRRVTGALFVFWEGVTLTMVLKSAHQLSYYESIESEKVPAKKQELQDWAVLLAFNHLLSAAEAYVSALLWDFPGDVDLRAVPSGLEAGLRVPLPGLP